MAVGNFPGLANIEAILRQIASNINIVNNTIAAVFPPPLTSSVTFNPPNILAGASATTTVTVTGATLGRTVMPSFSLDLAGLTLTAYVSAADTVTVVFFNGTAAPIDLASGALKVRVYV